MAKKHITKSARFSDFEVPKPLWKRVKHLFPKPPQKRGKGRPPLPNRCVLNCDLVGDVDRLSVESVARSSLWGVE